MIGVRTPKATLQVLAAVILATAVLASLRLVPASYNVVAWFWFPGDHTSYWQYSGLLNSEGTLSDLGSKYKELAGA